MNDDWQSHGTSNDLHVTFMFHCAFVRSEGARRTDVILAPGFGSPVGPAASAARAAAEHGNGHVNGNGHDINGGDTGGEPHDQQTHTHRMQHIASLRVPAACVYDEQEHPAQEVQETVTLGHTPDTAPDEDRIWRLEGYDVSIHPDGLGAAAASTPANFQSSVTDGDTTYTLASITLLGRRKIDPAYSSETVPELLHRGARVRVWGGTLSCGVPGGLLKHHTWDLGLEQPVGISDRVDYHRAIAGNRISVVFKKFETGETKTVTLQPHNGVIRLHITNDPFAEDTPHGSRAQSPCRTLPHFSSYAVLLAPAGTVTSLEAPPIADSGDAALATISEGNTFCCPCGDGVP
jgi:hypothetical protein